MAKRVLDDPELPEPKRGKFAQVKDATFYTQCDGCDTWVPFNKVYPYSLFRDNAKEYRHCKKCHDICREWDLTRPGGIKVCYK